MFNDIPSGAVKPIKNFSEFCRLLAPNGVFVFVSLYVSISVSSSVSGLCRIQKIRSPCKRAASVKWIVSDTFLVDECYKS